MRRIPATYLKDITQREFFELAAMELIKKYGYEVEVKGLVE